MRLATELGLGARKGARSLLKLVVDVPSSVLSALLRLGAEPRRPMNDQLRTGTIQGNPTV